MLFSNIIKDQVIRKRFIDVFKEEKEEKHFTEECNKVNVIGIQKLINYADKNLLLLFFYYFC